MRRLFCIAIMCMVPLLWCCKKRDAETKATLARLSNSLIKSCRATETSVFDMGRNHPLIVWSVRCKDGRTFACSRDSASKNRDVRCAEQTEP